MRPDEPRDRPDPPTGDEAQPGAEAHDDTGLDLARTLTRSLHSAARGRRPATGTPRRRTTELSSAHPDGRDPALVADAVEKLIDSSGWSSDLAAHGVFARWDEIVGEEVASHCHPERYADGRLVVRADSTAWTTELRLQAAMVLKRVNEELGSDTVTIIDFVGPEAPSWIKGRRTTRGGRGPRDTYG